MTFELYRFTISRKRGYFAVMVQNNGFEEKLMKKKEVLILVNDIRVPIVLAKTSSV